MFPINPSPLLRAQGLDPLMPMANGSGKGGGKAPKPDPNIGIAALRTAEIGEEALRWYKDIYAQEAPYRDEVNALSKEIAQSQLEASRKNQAIADDYYDYQTRTFRPMEQGIVDSANRFSTEAEQERLASQAAADVSIAGASQRTQLARSLSAMGVNPNSGRFAALNHDSNVLEAATRAGAMTAARQQGEQQGYARRMDAASLGRNLPANQATSQGIALSAGSSALQSKSVPAATTAAYGTLMGSGFNTAMQGNQAKAGILNTQYGNQLNAWNAQQQAAAQESAGLWSGIGTAAGMAVMASSKKLKTEKKPVEPVLEKLREVPVEEWKYKDGVADEGQHIGPYAEDMHEKFGEQVAPGGKMIDMISMLGINTAAIKELDKKVSRLEDKRS